MSRFLSFRPDWTVAAFLSLIAFTSVDTAFAQDAPANQVVARVNGEDITDADLQIAAQDFRETLMQLPPDQRLLGLINGIIDIRLMARAAEAAGLAKDEGAARRLQFVRDRALRGEYLRTNIFGAITEATVTARYDKEVAAFAPVDEIKASHILVETEDQAKAIIAQLDGGADFGAIAKEKSLDLGSGANGGDLGFFSAAKMVKPFADAAFGLAVGTYTKAPVKSDFGWHVIKVIEKRKSSPPTLEQRQAALQEEIAKEMFLAEVEKLRKTAKIELVQPPPAPGTPPADGATPPMPTPAPAPPQ